MKKGSIWFPEPIGGEISIACEAGLVDTVPKTSMEKRLMEQLKNSKFSRLAEKSQRGCYYTSIPHVVKQKGICGEELTSLNLDKVNSIYSIYSFNLKEKRYFLSYEFIIFINCSFFLKIGISFTFRYKWS